MPLVEIVTLSIMTLGALGGLAFFVGLMWRIAAGGAWVSSRHYALVHRLIFIGLALLLVCGTVALFLGRGMLPGAR
jgi:hypothetical protein